MLVLLADSASPTEIFDFSSWLLRCRFGVIRVDSENTAVLVQVVLDPIVVVKASYWKNEKIHRQQDIQPLLGGLVKNNTKLAVLCFITQ